MDLSSEKSTRRGITSAPNIYIYENWVDSFIQSPPVNLIRHLQKYSIGGDGRGRHIRLTVGALSLSCY